MPKIFLLFVFCSLFVEVSFVVSPKVVAQSCTNNPTSTDTVTSSFSVPENNTYTVWTRLIAPDSTNNSVWLQVDGGCAIDVGDSSSIPANILTWVNYQDGSASSLTTMNLTAGTHTLKLTEKEPGVGVDRVIFTTNTLCTPTGFGDNCPVPTNTPTPTISPLTATIVASPAATTQTIGTPFTVDIAVNGGSKAFNAAQANVAVSANLTINGISAPPSNACNFSYSGNPPSISNPSFAGAILASSSTACTVYRLTLTPNAAGTGTVTITNGSVKAYSDNSEILSGVTNGTYTITLAPTATPLPTATPTPIPTPLPTATPAPLQPPTVTSAATTYNASIILGGTKVTNVVSIFVNGITTGVTYPTSTTWQLTFPLAVGANSYAIYGKDTNNVQSTIINGSVARNKQSDINGDTVIDLTDLSLFGLDWGKTANFSNPLSDMNNDGIVNLTDFSILAKNYGQ